MMKFVFDSMLTRCHAQAAVCLQWCLSSTLRQSLARLPNSAFDPQFKRAELLGRHTQRTGHPDDYNV